MDSTVGEFKKHGGNDGNGDSSFSEVTYRPYDPSTDYASLLIMFHEYRKVLNDEDLDHFVTIGGDRPYRINALDGEILGYLVEDKAKIQVAEQDNRLIGFMIYHHIFDCILIVRGIHLVQKYRGYGWLMKGLIFSIGYVSRVFSQTYSKRGPKEIQGEKRARNLIYRGKDFNVWENVISKGHKGNKKWEVRDPLLEADGHKQKTKTESR